MPARRLRRWAALVAERRPAKPSDADCRRPECADASVASTHIPAPSARRAGPNTDAAAAAAGNRKLLAASAPAAPAAPTLPRRALLSGPATAPDNALAAVQPKTTWNFDKDEPIGGSKGSKSSGIPDFADGDK